MAIELHSGSSTRTDTLFTISCRLSVQTCRANIFDKITDKITDKVIGGGGDEDKDKDKDKDEKEESKYRLPTERTC